MNPIGFMALILIVSASAFAQPATNAGAKLEMPAQPAVCMAVAHAGNEPTKHEWELTAQTIIDALSKAKVQRVGLVFAHATEITGEGAQQQPSGFEVCVAVDDFAATPPLVRRSIDVARGPARACAGDEAAVADCAKTLSGQLPAGAALADYIRKLPLPESYDSPPDEVTEALFATVVSQKFSLEQVIEQFSVEGDPLLTRPVVLRPLTTNIDAPISPPPSPRRPIVLFMPLKE
jgi:hypothetical protein